MMQLLDLEIDQNRLHEMIVSLSTPAFLKDASSTFVACNQAFADYAQLDPADVVGKTDADMPWAGGTASTYMDWDVRIIESGASVLDISESITTAAGTVRPIETSKFPVRDPNGEVVAIFGNFRDLSSSPILGRAQPEDASVAGVLEDVVLRYLAGDSIATIAATIGTPAASVYAILRDQEFITSWQSTPASWYEFVALRSVVRDCRLSLIREEVRLTAFGERSNEATATLDRDLALVRKHIAALYQAIAASDMDTVREIIDAHAQSRVRELSTLLTTLDQPVELPDSAFTDWRMRYEPFALQDRYRRELARIESDQARVAEEMRRLS